MRFTLLSGVRNDLIQLISDQTAASELHLHQIDADTQIIRDHRVLRPTSINPTIVAFTDEINVAPHAVTNRTTYTVPANRRAIVSGAYVVINMTTAVTGTPIMQANLLYTPSGGAEIEILTHSKDLPVLGVNYTMSLNLDYPLNAGDRLRLQTAGEGTGGDFGYGWTLSIVEYDA